MFSFKFMRIWRLQRGSVDQALVSETKRLKQKASARGSGHIVCRKKNHHKVLLCADFCIRTSCHGPTWRSLYTRPSLSLGGTTCFTFRWFARLRYARPWTNLADFPASYVPHPLRGSKRQSTLSCPISRSRSSCYSILLDFKVQLCLHNASSTTALSKPSTSFSEVPRNVSFSGLHSLDVSDVYLHRLSREAATEWYIPTRCRQQPEHKYAIFRSTCARPLFHPLSIDLLSSASSRPLLWSSSPAIATTTTGWI